MTRPQITGTLALMLGMALFAFDHSTAQSKEELASGRQRGWSEQEIEAWDDYLTQVAKGAFRTSSSDECSDFTFRRDALLNGNKITSQITNFGSISAPGNRISDIVWNGLGYGFEFGPLVAAEIVDEDRSDPQSVPKRDADGDVVFDANGDTVWVMHIVSDGLVSNGGERSPDDSEWWGWQPIPCAQPVGSFEGLQVVDPASTKIPTSDDRDRDLDGKPDSWPDDWFNPGLQRFVWPGALQQGASNADKEALYFMNDYNNREFTYEPFPGDATRKGLGLEVEVRLYQWVNPLAEDAIFLIYKITNKSEKDLDNVIFGMWGDPHVGGPDNWPDDWAFFDRDLNMVFAWDDDGISDVAGRPPGYFGYKFLESPGIGNENIGGVFFPGDGIDNDGDGMVDESWTDGIDNDGDWDPERHDVGIDGIDGTGDEGEGDGLPTAGSLFDITKPGEPRFEFTDIDESDQIGLTSFASPPFAGNRVSNDDRVWDFIQPGRFDIVPDLPGDYVFLYGSGAFTLRAGDTKRFSIALIVGENRQDLELNAETVQQIYDAGYVFAKPPDKPNLTAVPGDEQVTLYWDSRAEISVDPFSLEEDFEGYVIYRSVDHQFSDQQTITDINGSRFLFKPLTTEEGAEAKFDLENGIAGVSPVPYPGRGVAYDLGDDTGLFHTFVDSNGVVNGQRYFYTVAAYDRGSPELDIPPTETARIITYDPQTDEYTFDVNTAAVIPRPRVAGYVPPTLDDLGLVQTSGHATGQITLRILDELKVEEGNRFEIDFDEVGDQVAYTVFDRKGTVDSLRFALGKSSGLSAKNVDPDDFRLTGPGGQTYVRDVDYRLFPANGQVQPIPGGQISDGTIGVASYTFAPVLASTRLANEESNPVFDGVQIFVNDVELAVNDEGTGWVDADPGLDYFVRRASTGPGREIQPADYTIRFADEPIGTSFSSGIPIPFEVINVTMANQPIQAFVPDVDADGAWDTEETIVFVEEIDGRTIATWEVQLLDPDNTGNKPGSGDVFFVRTDKPFTGNDAFEFVMKGATTDAEQTNEDLQDIYVVPNPYVATNEIEPRNPVSNVERGDRRLYFANVPAQCTIRIYTVNGELVDTIEHNAPLDDGKAFWDLRTKDNMDIAYGLYIFHVESAEGEFVGKFAVIK